MAENTAYQTDAFQNDAFQVGAEEPPDVPVMVIMSLDFGMNMKIE
jgi:hypothetical protein